MNFESKGNMEIGVVILVQEKCVNYCEDEVGYHKFTLVGGEIKGTVCERDSPFFSCDEQLKK